MKLLIIVIVILLVVLLPQIYNQLQLQLQLGGENFTTRAAKSRAITEWFATDSTPSYKEFRQNLGLTIVDYEIARKMNARGALSANELSQQL